jgi:ABC-type phosphate/phosphonate transport system substrate-binding protein
MALLGIECIQKAAIRVSTKFQLVKMPKGYLNPVWSLDENIEVLTRSKLRQDMGSILSAKLPEDTVQELSDVLFNIVYPAYMNNVPK